MLTNEMHAASTETVPVSWLKSEASNPLGADAAFTKFATQ